MRFFLEKGLNTIHPYSGSFFTRFPGSYEGQRFERSTSTIGFVFSIHLHPHKTFHPGSALTCALSHQNKMPRKYRLPQLIKLPHPPGHKINSIPPNPPPFAVMYDDVTLPTPHHPRGNADPADSFPTVHPMDEVNLNLGAYPVCGPIGSIFDSRSPSQRQGPPNPLQSWGAVLSWTPVTTSHSSQEVLRGESSFDISSTTYTPYPVSHTVLLHTPFLTPDLRTLSLTQTPNPPAGVRANPHFPTLFSVE